MITNNLLSIIILLIGILLVVLLLYNIYRSIILYNKIFKAEQNQVTEFANVCKDYIPIRNASTVSCETCLVFNCEFINNKTKTNHEIKT